MPDSPPSLPPQTGPAYPSLVLTAGDRSPLEPGDPLYETLRAAGRYVEAAKAPATRRAYDADWKHFVAWCEENGLASLPAEPGAVALYLAALANPHGGEKPRRPSTITRRLTSINTAHKIAGYDSPATMNHRLVAETLAGIRRTHGTAPAMKRPLTLARIVKILATLEGPIAAARDKALLLVGFVGGLRRSELASLRVEHLKAHRRGYTLSIPRSKTDQEGKGREVEILLGAHERTCPVMALENWLQIGGIKEGFVFRRVGLHGNVGASLDKDSIGAIVKKLVKRAKLAHPEEYGGHSLRAGFVTEASANGATDRMIMKQTGHKSIAMVHRYAREDQQDRQSAVSALGV